MENRLSEKELATLKKNGFDVMHDLHCVQPGCLEPVEQVHPIGMPLCRKHAAPKYWNAVSDSCKKLGIDMTKGDKWYK